MITAEKLGAIVQDCGKLLLQWRQTGGMEGQWEGSQFKAEADRQAHHTLESALRVQWPNVAVMSEEGDLPPDLHRPENYFMLDPIDGTASYVHGFDGFVTQIAYVEGCQPQVAAIFAPALNQLYLAVYGQGSSLNGQPLKMSGANHITSIIDNYPEARGVTAKLVEDFEITTYVECGSIALKICKVASGVADLFFKDVPVRDWDVAAPQLVITEAGGVLSDAFGHTYPYRGSFEHHGLIACGNVTQQADISAWYTERIK